MLEEVLVIVLEERLYSILTVDRNGNVKPQKIVNNSLFHQEINPHFWRFYKWYLNESFNDVKRRPGHSLSRRTAWFHLKCGL